MGAEEFSKVFLTEGEWVEMVESKRHLSRWTTTEKVDQVQVQLVFM